MIFHVIWNKETYMSQINHNQGCSGGKMYVNLHFGNNVYAPLNIDYTTLKDLLELYSELCCIISIYGI